MFQAAGRVSCRISRLSQVCRMCSVENAIQGINLQYGPKKSCLAHWMICVSVQIIYKDKSMEYVVAKVLVALTWQNESLSSFSSVRHLQKNNFNPRLHLCHLPFPCSTVRVPGPRAYFLFVLAQGATYPERPTAWSLPAVSSWQGELGYTPESESDWRNTQARAHVQAHMDGHTRSNAAICLVLWATR